MHKTKILARIMIIIVILIVGLGGYIAFRNHKKSVSANTQSTGPKTACQLFTLSEAKKLFGNSVKDSPLNKNSGKISSKNIPGVNNAPTQTLKETGCIYLKSTTGKPANDIAASIAVKTSTPDQAKKEFFATKNKAPTLASHSSLLKPEKISGYGEDAYWKTNTGSSSESYSELTVLSKNNIVWIFGRVDDLDLSKKIAHIVVTKL